jgi:hypothetical protein
MSLFSLPNLALGSMAILAISTIAFVHYSQKKDRETMHIAVIKDRKRLRQREREMAMRESSARTTNESSSQ